MGSLVEIERDASGAWFDEQVTTGARAQRSESQVVLIERSASTGHMAPLHTHDEGETYRVLDGEVTFFIGTDVVRAAAGHVVVAPDGIARTFRAESDARWLVVTRVRSLQRFLDFGLAISPPLPAASSSWPSPSERDAVAAIAAANGIELLGPPGALPDRR